MEEQDRCYVKLDKIVDVGRKLNEPEVIFPRKNGKSS